MDDESFARLTPPHVGSMLRVATALLGPANAEDATQEALLRAWRAWDTLRDPGALRGWLLRITVNVCHQWRRGRFGAHQRHTQSLPDETIAGEWSTNDNAWAGPALAALGADLGTSDHTGALDLRQAVNQLGADHRLVILLRFYGGMEPTEIGLALGIPAATVRTRLHRALALLRQRLGDDTAPNPGNPGNRGNPRGVAGGEHMATGKREGGAR